MEHVTGSIGQSVRQDYGEFISISYFRVRKELVTAYSLTAIGDDDEKPFGIRLCVNHDIIGIPIGSREEAMIWLEKLDWIYKKDGRDND